MKLFSSLSKKVIDVKDETNETSTVTNDSQKQSTGPPPLVIHTSWQPPRFEDSPYATSGSEVCT